MLNMGVKKDALERLEEVSREYGDLGEVVKDNATALFEERREASKQIKMIGLYVNELVNTSKEFKDTYEKVQINLEEFEALMEIKTEEVNARKIGGGITGAGVAAGVGVAMLGSSAAMAIATTFGTTANGTAISSLKGSAATTAALAWIGGGTVAAGGGGVVAGRALLALASRLGWGIGGTALLGSGIYLNRKNKKAAKRAKKEILQIEKQKDVLAAANVEIENLITVTSDYCSGILSVFDSLKSSAPRDYNEFSEDQKLELGALESQTMALSELINRKVG